MGKLTRFLNWFDLFSSPIQLTYDGKKSYGTTCGGLVTLIIFLLLCGLFISRILEMYNRDVPQLFQSIHSMPWALNVLNDRSFDNMELKRFEVPESIANSTTYFYISFGIRSQVGSQPLVKIDPSYINFTIHEISNLNGVETYRPLKYSLCTKFGTADKAKFDELQLNMTYCINDAYAIDGVKGFNGSSVLRMKLKRCVGATYCKSMDLITKYLIDTKIETYYQTQSLNTSNTENPIISTVDQFYWDIHVNNSKITTLDLELNKFEDHQSFLPTAIDPSFTSKYFTEVGEINDLFKDIDDPYWSHLTFYVVKSKVYTVTKRKYMDVISQIAIIGGITGIVFAIGFLFVIYCANFVFKSSITNGNYNVISPEKEVNVLIPFKDYLRDNYHKQIANYIKKSFYDLKKKKLLAISEGKMNKGEEKQNLDRKATAIVLKEIENIKLDETSDFKEQKTTQRAYQQNTTIWTKSKAMKQTKKDKDEKQPVAILKEVDCKSNLDQSFSSEIKANYENLDPGDGKDNNSDLFRHIIQGPPNDGLKSKRTEVSEIRSKKQTKAIKRNEEKEGEENILDHKSSDDECFSEKDSQPESSVLNSKRFTDQLKNKHRQEIPKYNISEAIKREDLDQFMPTVLNERGETITEEKARNQKNLTKFKTRIEETGKGGTGESQENILSLHEQQEDEDEDDSYESVNSIDGNQNLRSAHKRSMALENNEEKIAIKKSATQIVENVFEDNEGVFDDDLETIGKFLNINTVEKMFGKTKEERDDAIVNTDILDILEGKLESSENENENETDTQEQIKIESREISLDESGEKILELLKGKNFFNIMFDKLYPNSLYHQNKTIYNVFKYGSNDKLYFSICEILLKLFCSTCIKRYRTQKENSERHHLREANAEKPQLDYIETLDKKFELLEASDDKLSFDFDIVNILKAIDDFEIFKGIYFDGPQYRLFNSLANKVISELNEVDMDAKEREEVSSQIKEINQKMSYSHYKRMKTEVRREEMTQLEEEARDQREIQVIMDNLLRMSQKKFFTINEKNLFMVMGLEVKDIREYEKSLTFNPKDLDLDNDGIPDEEERRMEIWKDNQISVMEKIIDKFGDKA